MPQVQPPSLLLLPSRPVPLTAMTDHTPTPRVVRAIDPVERINELERELKMTLQMLSDARTERDEARRSLANSAHVANAARVIAWARDPNRKPANTAFTAGAERQAAYWIEWAQLHDALPTGGLPPSDVEAYAEELKDLLRRASTIIAINGEVNYNWFTDEIETALTKNRPAHITVCPKCVRGKGVLHELRTEDGTQMTCEVHGEITMADMKPDVELTERSTPRVDRHLEMVPERFKVIPEFQGLIKLARELESQVVPRVEGRS